MANAQVEFRSLGLNLCRGGFFLGISNVRVKIRALAQAVLVADSTGREAVAVIALGIGDRGHQHATGNRSGNAQRSSVKISPFGRFFSVLITGENLGNTEVIVRCEAIKQPLRRSVFPFPGVELECLKPRLRLRKRGLKLPKTR